MKTVRITGGLGNQLFQYAFGLYLSQQTKDKIFYDPQTKSDFKAWVSRKFELNKFVSNNIDIQHTKSFLPILYRIKRKVAQCFPFFFKHFIVEDKQHVDIDNYKLLRGNYFDGYWQCLNYVEIVKETIFKNIDNYRNTVINTEIGTEIYDSDSTTISLHVRHGDYLNNPQNLKTYGICPKSYYLEAIGYTRNILNRESLQIYVFTDDEEWCEENFKELNCKIISGNSAEIDLILMSLCKHNIIANSTFSWWGAYLNLNPKKIVIAPKQWYVKYEASDLRNFLPSNYIYL